MSLHAVVTPAPSRASRVAPWTCSNHARDRALGRFGIELTDAFMEEIGAAVDCGDESRVILMARDSHNTAYLFVAIRARRRWVPAIVDQKERCLITVLPEDAFRNHRKRLAMADAQGRGGR